MIAQIFPIILAGGAGSRLWPLSTPEIPKPLLTWRNQKSLLQHTLERLQAAPVGAMTRPLLVCSHANAEAMLQEAQGRVQACIAEPQGRNTGPAIMAALHWVLAHHPAAYMLVVPCDHVIAPQHAFDEAVMRALAAARQPYLVAIGVKPVVASVHYGYMAKAAPLERANTWRVAKFHEKPDLVQAQTYVQQGALCNSGIFMFPVALLAQECSAWAPQSWQCCVQAMQNATTTTIGQTPTLMPDPVLWAALTPEPIDRLIMERTTHAAVAEGAFDWSDVGSFEAWWQHAPKDTQGNAVQGNVQLVHCTDCLCINRTKAPLELMHQRGMCVVRTEAGEICRPLSLA